jgi:hypothetical protein
MSTSDKQQPTQRPRLPFLGWCLLLSTIANISSLGILIYLAFGMLDVRVRGGYVDAYIQDGPAVRAVTVEGPVTVKTAPFSPLEVEGDVTVKTGPYSPLDVRVAR